LVNISALNKGETALNVHAKILIIALACASNVFMAKAWAAGSDRSGVYLGIGGGATRTTIDDLESGINANLIRAGFTNATTETKSNSGMYKAFIGYSFNAYFAIEGTYFNLGRFTFDSTVTPTGTLHGETKSQGGNLDIVLSYPFDEGVILFGRIGADYAKSNADLMTSGSVSIDTSSTTESSWGRHYGLGLGYEFSGHTGVRGEWEYYQIPDGTNTHTQAKVDVLAVSLYYKF
jgi:OOP family OmpA-OmpF porin